MPSTTDVSGLGSIQHVEQNVHVCLEKHYRSPAIPCPFPSCRLVGPKVKFRYYTRTHYKGYTYTAYTQSREQVQGFLRHTHKTLVPYFLDLLPFQLPSSPYVYIYNICIRTRICVCIMHIRMYIIPTCLVHKQPTSKTLHPTAYTRPLLFFVRTPHARRCCRTYTQRLKNKCRPQANTHTRALLPFACVYLI